MEGYKTYSSSRKRISSLSEKQKEIRKIEIPKVFVKNKDVDADTSLSGDAASLTSRNERQKRDVNQNMKEHSKTSVGTKNSNTTADSSASSAVADVIDKPEGASHQPRPRVTRRMSSTIRRIQEKIRKEQMKDMAGGNLKEGQQQDYYAVAINALAVVRNARRQRSKSRTKQGKMKCDQLQRPYRRWLGVSTCVASDTRFIVCPNRTDEIDIKTDECKNNNETNDGSQESSGNTSNSIFVNSGPCPDDSNRVENPDGKKIVRDEVNSDASDHPSGSQSKRNEHQTHTESIISSEQISSPKSHNKTRARPRQRKKHLRFRDSKSRQTQDQIADDDQDEDIQGTPSPPDDTRTPPATKLRKLEPVPAPRREIELKRNRNETDRYPSTSDYSLQPSEGVEIDRVRISHTENGQASPLPFEFSLDLVENDKTFKTDSAPTNDQINPDDECNVSEVLTTLEDIDPSKSEVSFPSNDETEKDYRTSQLLHASKDDSGLSTSEIFLRNEEMDGDVLASDRYSTNDERVNSDYFPKSGEEESDYKASSLQLHSSKIEGCLEIPEFLIQSTGDEPNDDAGVQGLPHKKDECFQLECFHGREEKATEKDGLSSTLGSSKDGNVGLTIDVFPQILEEKAKEDDSGHYGHSAKDEINPSECCPRPEDIERCIITPHLHTTKEKIAPSTVNINQQPEEEGIEEQAGEQNLHLIKDGILSSKSYLHQPVDRETENEHDNIPSQPQMTIDENIPSTSEVLYHMSVGEDTLEDAKEKHAPSTKDESILSDFVTQPEEKGTGYVFTAGSQPHPSKDEGVPAISGDFFESERRRDIRRQCLYSSNDEISLSGSTPLPIDDETTRCNVTTELPTSRDEFGPSTSEMLPLPVEKETVGVLADGYVHSAKDECLQAKFSPPSEIKNQLEASQLKRTKFENRPSTSKFSLEEDENAIGVLGSPINNEEIILLQSETFLELEDSPPTEHLTSTMHTAKEECDASFHGFATQHEEEIARGNVSSKEHTKCSKSSPSTSETINAIVTEKEKGPGEDPTLFSTAAVPKTTSTRSSDVTIRRGSILSLHTVSDQGGLAGNAVSHVKYQCFPPKPPIQPSTPPTSKRKVVVKPISTMPISVQNRIINRNSLRQEVRTFKDRQLFEVKAFCSPRKLAFKSLAKKFKKSPGKKEFINVLAIKDCEGTLPGQLAFKKGQTIKQMDTGLRDVDGMFYGYYRVGRLRRKVWGIYPSTHVSLFFDSDEDADVGGNRGNLSKDVGGSVGGGGGGGGSCSGLGGRSNLSLQGKVNSDSKVGQYIRK